MSTRGHVQTLRRQIEEVVDADWSHTGWWGLTWLTGLLETLGGPRRPEDRVRYHGANGGPHSDTFMGRPRLGSDRRESSVSLAHWGVSRALAALAAMEEWKQALPGQPLRVALAWEGRWMSVVPLPDSTNANVVFTVRGRHFLAKVTAARVDALARGLGRLLAGAPTPDGFRPLTEDARVPASLVVCLDVHHHDEARHVHRHAWSRYGGPWLGIVRTNTMELVTTCHLVTDGLGHALLTDRILGDDVGPMPHRDGDPLGFAPWAAAGATQARHPRRSKRTPAGSPSLSTGLAWRLLPEGLGRFPEQAYATGIALETFYGPGGHAPAPRRFTPPFTVPVAPGEAEDPDRRMRRVVHGLLSVGLDGAAFEPFDAFQKRLGPWLETERSGRGILARISSAVSRGPMPRRLKHLALSNHHGPRASIPSVEGLSGRARLSSIRFPGGAVAPPMIAASLPTLLPNIDDDRGGVVVTLIHHDEGTTVTAFGTGRAGTTQGAEDFLERWIGALGSIRGT